MIKIRAIKKVATVIDLESGIPRETESVEPEFAFPSNVVRIECDGEFYTVYEPGD